MGRSFFLRVTEGTSLGLGHPIIIIISSSSSQELKQTLLQSPGSRYVPDEPVAPRHSANLDGVAEAPVGRHQRRLSTVQGQDGLLGQQVVEANRPLLLRHH